VWCFLGEKTPFTLFIEMVQKRISMMQWYRGEAKTLFDRWEFSDNPLWADYQVLGPSFAAISVFMGLKDVMPIIVGARGCAAHIRFTKIAWGGDFFLEHKPLPFIEVTRSDVVHAQYHISQPQLESLRKLVASYQPALLVIMSNDDILLTCANMEPLVKQLQEGTGIRTEFLEVSPLSGKNQWAGYDKSLGLLYRSFLNEKIEKNEGINLVGWKWPSRERKHDIGACLALLEQVDVKVNHVIPGGSSLEDIRHSLASRANLMWCPSYVGETLEMLAEQKGLPLAGFTPPYGFEGTTSWLGELAEVLGRQDEIMSKANAAKQAHLRRVIPLQNTLGGVKGFVSGGPGRLPGLLSIMADLGVEVVAAALYWPHPNRKVKDALQHVVERLPKPLETLLVAPSLYDLEEIAAQKKIDFWMGGYQEQHACKHHGIPFIPTTVYTASHQCYEGVFNVGSKIEKAMQGFDFVANPFQSVADTL
jgi:nitrogenase molybdenum-iron protein alpha/beta subunit